MGAVIEDMFCEECWWGRVCGDRENQFEPGPFVLRPHQHLAGLTPAEVWGGLRWKVKPVAGSNVIGPANGIAAIAALPPVREEFWFEVWDGLLTGYYLRR